MTVWTGESWQEYALRLLRLRYPLGQLVRVPDKHVGDFGLEAFARDGLAFQCYSPEEPISTKERYEKHRNKVTKDIRKLTDPDTLQDLATLLNPTRITTWCLVVPFFDSALLLQHTATKAQEVRALGLSHLKEDFTINVLQESDFPQEAKALIADGLRRISIAPEPVEPSEVANWAATNVQPVKVLDEKLDKVPTLTATTRRTYRHEMLTRYLVSENILAQLREDHPDVYESVSRCKSEKEEWLAVTCPVAEGPANVTLGKVLNEYQEVLAERVPSLDGPTLGRVVTGTVADWLIRCPLRFP